MDSEAGRGIWTVKLAEEACGEGYRRVRHKGKKRQARARIEPKGRGTHSSMFAGTRRAPLAPAPVAAPRACGRERRCIPVADPADASA
eukprot:845465-Pleurochrysis_carterae.AAC.1